MTNSLTLIVTYNGADTVGETLRSCLSSHQDNVRPVVVIDNASRDETVSVVESFSLPYLEIVKQTRNGGLARAYNVGLEKAIGSGVEWLFILDQDSVCGSRCLDLLLKTADELMKEGERVGAVCPTARSRFFSDIIHHPYRWTSRGLRPVLEAGGLPCQGPIAIDSGMSSGTVYRVEALAAIGGFRDKYFIDFVDHECHIRLRRAGWSLWWETRAELYHRLGRIQRMTDEGIWIEHDPIRYYYMARNMTDAYWRLGGLQALLHFGGEIWRHGRRLRRNGEAPRECISYICRGVRDAFLGKFGPLDTAR